MQFLNYARNDGFAMLHCGCALWSGFSNPVIPEGLLEYFQIFINQKESKNLEPATNEAQVIKGKKIWDVLKSS